MSRCRFRSRLTTCGPFFAALALLWLFPASLLAQGAAYRVEIDAPAGLRKRLEDNLDIVRWAKKDSVGRAVLQRLLSDARSEIETLLATEGYYSPTIHAQLQERDGERVVRLEIEPGAPVRVSAVDIDFTGDIADGSAGDAAQIAKARAGWALERGEVFRQAAWEDAKDALLRALVVYRFPAARIAASRAVVDPKTKEARLQVTMDSGPEFTFGELDIDGLKRYPRSVVENLNRIEPGAPYDQTRILKLQQSLQQTAYFSNVVVNVEVDPQRPKRVPVQVRVTEEKSKRLGFGLGYSTDTGVRGRIQYTDINILDRGWRFNSAIEAERISQTVAGNLYFPVTERGIQDSIESSYAHRRLAGEVTDTVRVGVSRAQRVGRVDRVLSVQYQYEEQEVGATQQDTREALVVSSAWTRRRLDDLLHPRDGYVVNFQLGGAHEALLSDRSFLRGYLRALYYQPLTQKSNLILRGEVGVVEAQARNGIPSDFLFRAGGDQSIRGYAYQSLGVEEAGAVLGGRYLAVASVEYDYWFRERWGAAVFYDTGDAADSVSALERVEGVGAGVRWRSPIGLVNLDLAYGREVRDTRIHFTVGFVF